jgi:hypothetical protein
MNQDLVRKIADTILYEGYMLYPYRRSAIKNRQRWTFGILYPPAYPEVSSGTERSLMHSECLISTSGSPSIEIEVRFLHLIAHEVHPTTKSSTPGYAESWDEGVERSVRFKFDSPLSSQSFNFSFPGKHESEPLQDASVTPTENLTRIQHEVNGTISVSSERALPDVIKLTIDVANETSLPTRSLDRDSALLRSLLSAHTVLSVENGEFVSLLDPPNDLQTTANSCKNIGNFPVLVGDQDKNQRDTLLCSPILLYDYPQIAPESSGDFYDGTEMDEMLTLRVMTLTDEEKDQMRLGDDRVRSLLQRTEENVRDQLMRTHGTIRSLRPISENREPMTDKQ